MRLNLEARHWIAQQREKQAKTKACERLITKANDVLDEYSKAAHDYNEAIRAVQEDE